MRQILIYLYSLFPLLCYGQNYVALLDVDVISETTIDERPAISTSIPFSIKEGMIIVDAEVNQIKGKFILDTGAPSLVLNQIPNSGQLGGNGISNAIEITPIEVQDFSWATINKQNIAAYKVDISHLEAISQMPIAGIIGYDILREVELSINYHTQTVQLHPTKKTSKHPSQAIAVIPFTLQGHLPVIKVKVGNKKVRLGLDTASESNILDQKFLKKITDTQIGEIYEGELQGLDQQIKKVKVASVQQTSAKDLQLSKMNYLFTDLSNLRKESDLYIDGLLGYPFFS